MDTKNRRTKVNLFLILLLICFISLSACGGGASSEGEIVLHDGQTGSVAFRIKWGGEREASALPMRQAQSPSGDVCVDYGIQTVSASIYNAANESLAMASFPCEKHSGIIEEVPVGSGLQLKVEGLVGADVLWRGQLGDITVEAGLTTPAGEITVEYVGDDTQPPKVAEIFPIADAEGVGLDEVIQITFDEPIVPASANAQTVRLSAGDAGVAGQIAYDTVLKKVTFTPSAPLAYSTIYTVTVTTGIEDPAANPLPQETVWHFTTQHLTFTAGAGTGGSITPDGQIAVPYGTSPLFTITPDDGYYLSELRVDGGPVTPTLSYTFPSADTGHTIAASFKPVWYVDGSLGGSGNGKTWATAFNTIPASMAVAENGDEIWIRGDDYFISGTISVSKPVEIYGGFAGNEFHRDQRDFDAHPTVIDGSNLRRCFNVGADAVIDGLVIRNGRNENATWAYAGALDINGASPLIKNCIFQGNTAVEAAGQTGEGGAIYNHEGGGEIVDCIFEDNQVGGHGYGSGGAVYNNNSTVIIRGSTFYLNQCTNGYGDYGGALYNSSGTPAIIDCRFIENVAGGEDSHGGAICNEGSNAVITNCTFINNKAWPLWGIGGAIENRNCNPVITNCIFAGNRAIGRQRARGGAIYNYQSVPLIRNSTLYQNVAEEYGVDIMTYGGGIYNDNSGSSATPVTITDSILWGNVAESGLQIYDDASTTTITYSNMEQTGYTGSGLIRREPFLGAAYHLQEGSPCKDAGNPASTIEDDIDGESRLADGGQDMGADEFMDTDGDRMPDLWELNNDLNPGADDAAGNPDKDAFLNVEEYRMGTDPNAATPFLDAENRGWWGSDGYHNGKDNSTVTGRNGSYDYRSYFIFNLEGQSGTVKSALLRLYLTDYASTDNSEYIKIWDILDTDHSLLETGTGDTAVYTDLGTGRPYGSMIVTLAEENSVLELRLNPLAIDDINDAIGGGTFAVGISMEESGGSNDNRIRFSDGLELREHRLVLEFE